MVYLPVSMLPGALAATGFGKLQLAFTPAGFGELWLAFTPAGHQQPCQSLQDGRPAPGALQHQAVPT